MSILWIFTYYKETSTKPIKQATLKVFNMILYEYLLVRGTRVASAFCMISFVVAFGKIIVPMAVAGCLTVSPTIYTARANDGQLVIS